MGFNYKAINMLTSNPEILTKFLSTIASCDVCPFNHVCTGINCNELWFDGLTGKSQVFSDLIVRLIEGITNESCDD